VLPEQDRFMSSRHGHSETSTTVDKSLYRSLTVIKKEFLLL
jgi:hypothetical protein